MTGSEASTTIPVSNNAGGCDPEDEALKSLKREHLESLAKVRNERDLLEEQEKLEDLKERIQRRKDEKKRELDHEDWIAQQKREIISRRLQQALHRDEEKTTEFPAELQIQPGEPYNFDNGFGLFWDFATGLPLTTEDLQVYSHLVTS